MRLAARWLMAFTLGRLELQPAETKNGDASFLKRSWREPIAGARSP